jgi:creatinine amidohydrolase
LDKKMQNNARKVKFEEMLPAELGAVIRGASVACLPVGSMEWHGPHMSMGMDTIHAYAVALGVAEQLGGAAMPPLYIGTECMRTPETLRKIGFVGNESIIGMDFPKNSVRSMYWPEELFRAMIRQQLLFLCGMGFRTVAVINGHGANNQVAALREIAEELTAETGSRIVSMFILSDSCGVKIGHAGLAETSVMQALAPDGVDLRALPAKPEKIKNVDYAIVDSETFTCGGNRDFTVRYDPRDATAAIGQAMLDKEIARCVRMITEPMS